MSYLLSISTIIYGLLLHHKVFIPRVDRGGPTMYIVLGIILLIAIPFLEKLDEPDKEKKEKILSNNYFCFWVYGLGIIMFLAYMFELQTSDIIYAVCLLAMGFCQTVVNLIKKLIGKQ